MKIFSRIFLTLLATAGVGALGYYAFLLTSQTLVFPFIGTDTQYGDVLEGVVSPPSLHFGKTNEPLIDAVALREAITHSGVKIKPEQVLSGEYNIEIKNSYFRISRGATSSEEKKVIPLVISADIYNKNKSTRYRLPKDIVLYPTDIPRTLSFTQQGDPRDQIYNISLFQLYNVSLYGRGQYTPDQIRYYVHYEKSADCQISSWGSPLPSIPRVPDGYNTVVSSGADYVLPILKTPWIFQSLDPEVIVPSSKDGQTWISKVKIPYDLTQSRVCIIAGVAGQYRVIEDRILDPFTLTGVLLQALSPEYDMKSQIEFDFSHDIYSDVGTLYSPEYMNHRHEAKIAFLKSLKVTPAVEINTENLVLTPNRAILTLPLAEGTQYTFSLTDVTDIYGRKAETTFQTKLKSEPFLSLRLSEQKNIYTPNEPINAKLFSLLPPKKSYSLKLCQVNLETYSRIERMLSDDTLAKNELITSLMKSQEVKDCRAKEIVLTDGSYVSPFSVDEFFLGGKKKTGMFILYFSQKEDTDGFTRFIAPILFSVIDTHLTLKVDASGKLMVLATDIESAMPLPDQEITLMRNVSRTHTEKWDPNTGKTEITYLPLTAQAFATGITLGKTDGEGFLDTQVGTLSGIDSYESSPYGLSFEDWWEYEGRYESFLVQSRSGDRLGLLVSTWNDGITGYNFGIKDSDYSYQSRPQYTTYIHTDRRLYLPGEKVYIHAILRKNSDSLDIPKDVPFEIIIQDSLGKEKKREVLKPNDFGSIFTELVLDKDAPLGEYSISINTLNTTEYVQNGWSNFQVQVFQNPTFTAAVELRSPDLEDGYVRDLRKMTNTDPYNPWYKDIYVGDFAIEGIVKAKYYNGAEIKNTPFTYRVYRSEYYSQSYWGDCFWGCYYEPPLVQYTEGSGMIDGDGFGIIRVPVEFSSYYSDYKYTIEVTLRDPLTGEEVTTPGSLVVKLPDQYKAFSPENPLNFTPKKKILSPGEALNGEFHPKYGKWNPNIKDAYRYEIIHREYRETFIDDIRSGKVRVTTPNDTVIASGSVSSKEFSYKMIAQKAGEYRMRVIPLTVSEPPESSISETIFYITGDFSSLKDGSLRVVPERTIYKIGETARVMIQVPFTGSHLLITQEKGGIIDREYLTLTGNTLTREYLVDDTFVPNSYIGVVALNPKASSSARTYAVGYGEIVTDIADKKSIITLNTDKNTYKNRETVTVDMTLTDRSGNPLQGEITLMVVDESLIRLLGNIDLDIIPKFYQKYPFTMKTALSAIGIERNRFLSRKGSNGGGGNKGGGGAQISSRTLFQNTAFYAPSIRTDASGKAKTTFPLPDNVTDYRIIALSSTLDSKFGVAEKTIEVRKDYVLEVAAPMIARKGDTFTLITTVFNNTKKITPAEVVLTFGTGSQKIEKRNAVNLGVMERKGINFSLQIPENIENTISYTVIVREGDTVLDSITKSITVPQIPIVYRTIRTLDVFTGTTFTHTLTPTSLSNTDPTFSSVEVRVASSYANYVQEGIESLLQYPYGCIEQTISSTLPNRIALSLAEAFGLSIDANRARENTKKGLEKILRMQHFSGGWTYWEGSDTADYHITPYVLRSLLQFRNLGESIPEYVFENGISYIVNNEGEYANNPDSYAEAVWTLASLKDTRALLWWTKIDTAKLSRHGYVAYAYAAHKLGKFTPEIENRLFEVRKLNDDSWYWSRYADDALMVQLFLERKDISKAINILDPLVRSLDLSSYYVSTQEKSQTLIALIEFTKSQNKLTSPIDIAFRSEGLIADLDLSPSKMMNSVTSNRQRLSSSYTLRRDNTKVPLLVTTVIKDRPKDITSLPAYSTGGIQIMRTFEQIDESQGIDMKGDFNFREPVDGKTFQKGKLYRVTLTVTPTNIYSRNLAVEDFFPGAWRPINTLLQTEKSSLDQGYGDISWWSHTESREDRLLAHRDYLYENSPLTYRYYFRPEFVGDYILPPATAYMMYQPEVHAYTEYTRIKVTE